MGLKQNARIMGRGRLHAFRATGTKRDGRRQPPHCSLSPNAELLTRRVGPHSSAGAVIWPGYLRLPTGPDLPAECG